MGTRWPPHSNVVDGALEVAEARALALGRRATYEDLRQARLKHEVFLEVDGRKVIAARNVLAVDKHERLCDNHSRIRARSRILPRRPQGQGNVVPGTQKRGAQRPPRLDDFFSVAGREDEFDVIARIGAFHVPPQSRDGARVGVEENGLDLARTHDE